MALAADTPAAAREHFPITRRVIYFDVANMSSPPACVTQTLAEFFNAMQERGGDKKAWLSRIEATRASVAALLGCDADEIAFCKNTSEGLNIAANAFEWQPGDNVVLPRDEHPNNIYPWLNLRRHSVDVRLAPKAKEWVDAGDLRAYVDGRTRVVTLANVSFLPGQRNDVADVGKLCHASGAELVVDAVQALGLLKVDVRELGISMLAASAHKGLLTPHGIGVLFCRRDLISQLHPAYAARASAMPNLRDDHAVDSSEILFQPDARRFELGNFNYSGIAALGAALELILSVGIERIERHVLDLAEYLTREMSGLGIVRLGPSDPARRSSICAFDLPGEGWIEYFAENGIIVSGRLKSVRVSFGFYNTFDEVDRFVSVVKKRMHLLVK